MRGAAPVTVVTVEPGSLADLAAIREGDYLVSLMDRDVKWSSHTQVVNMITEAMTYLRLTVVSPIKPWTKYKHSYSESISSKPDQASVSSSSSSGSSTNIIRVFTPSSSRTSFSSMSSTSSKESDSNLDNQKQRKKTWAVLQIKNYK